MRRRLTLLSMRRRCIEFEELINTLSKLLQLWNCMFLPRSRFNTHLPVRRIFCACILKGRSRVCVSRFDANWIVMATWKFRSIIHRADTDGSRFRAKKNPRAPCEYLFLFVSASRAIFNFSGTLFASSGWIFAKEETMIETRRPGKRSFGSPSRHEYFHRFCISQFRSVFPKFCEVFTPWGIFKREIVTCTCIYTSDSPALSNRKVEADPIQRSG